jgi:magnesium chelatase family protein
LQIQRYVGRISGPLLDRIDIHIDVPAVKFRELAGDEAPETDSSETIRQRVITARERQLKRFQSEKIFCNAAMTPRMIRKQCQIDEPSERLLEQAMIRQGLSARAYDRILKVSRTIADLEGCDHIASTHVSEAVGYRSLDRTYWT